MGNALGPNGVTDRWGGGSDGLIDDQAANGYMEIGSMQTAWGREDSILGTPEFFPFPVPFGAPPVVQIARTSPGAPLTARQVSTTGFTIDRADILPNPIPFTWTASGITPETIVPPSTRFNVIGLPVWSAAVRAQKAGKRNARVLCIGDSTTAGYGSMTAGMEGNDAVLAWPTQLATIMTARGSFSSWSSFTGGRGLPGANSIPLYDTRIALQSTWETVLGELGTTVGGGIPLASTATSKITFTPMNQCDTFEFYILQRDPNGANSGFNLAINNNVLGVASSLWDNGNPANLGKYTVTAALGNNVFSAQARDTSGVFMTGFIGYNSAVKEITVLNGGWGGSRAADVNNGTTNYGPLKAIAAYNPDLVVICLGINDWNQPTATVRSSWVNSMQNVIDAAKNSGADVILMAPNDTTGTYAARRDAYVGYTQELATKNGLKMIDLKTVLGAYAAANAAGYMRDTLHPNAAGYQLVATAVADMIMPAA